MVVYPLHKHEWVSHQTQTRMTDITRLGEVFGPTEHTTQLPSVQFLIDPISSFEFIVPLYHNVRHGCLLHASRRLRSPRLMGPSLLVEKSLTSIRRGGVLWFPSWNPPTHRMCYTQFTVEALPCCETPNLSSLFFLPTFC